MDEGARSVDGASGDAPGEPTPERIRVLLVDDHAVVRRGLRGFLELQPDVEIVGEAEDGRTGVELARTLRPDVVLMDLVMPRLDGIGAIVAIKDELPEVEIIALTSFLEEERVQAALEAGAAGYVLKDAEADDVVAAIRSAHRGEVHLDPKVASFLARRVRERRSSAPPAEELTDRERDVLRLVARGLPNQSIANDLGISERTARTHVSNILGKLDLASRTQAALWAIEHGLIERDRA
jgi:DNA-binding NarL/FixJ family response regulator